MVDMEDLSKENTPKPRYGRRCVAGGCSNTNANGVPVHKFPTKRPEIHRQWVTFVRRKRRDWEPTRHSVLCGAHFEEDCYPLKFRLGLIESGGKTIKHTLKENAVPTIHPPTQITPQPGKRTGPIEDETTPKTSRDQSAIKRHRSAFVKRDIQRLLREYAEGQVQATEHHTSQVSPIELDEGSSMEVTVICKEPKYKSVASQKNFCRPSHRSHYTQTTFKGKDKGCQASRPQTREIGIMCDIISSPHPQPVTTIPLPDPSPAISDPGSFTSAILGSDQDYEMESDMSSDSEGEDDRTESNRRFLVDEEKLMERFHRCPRCAQSTYGEVKNIRGSCISVEQDCGFCHYNRVWTSQTMIGSMPSGNLAISSAILFSGSLPTKTLRFFEFMNTPTVSYSSFMCHQRYYLQPVISDIWKSHQEVYFEATRAAGKSICIGGDGRSDTPGHSAKYGSYTVMDLDC